MTGAWKKGFIMVVAAGLLAFLPASGASAATGTVTASSVKVRESASTQASHVFSLNIGDKVDIVSEEKDSSGYVWYKIKLEEGGYGYVRSDLVQSDGEVPPAQDNAEPAAASETPAENVQLRQATVKAERANVRAGAGTVYDSVGTVGKGDELVAGAETEGTDGKTWYQVKFGEDGKEGFIRSDLIELGDVIEQETPEAPEETAGADDSDEKENAGGSALSQAVSQGNGEYSLAYKADEAGLETWYLYDNVESTQVKLTDLLNAANNGRAAETLLKQNRHLKIAIIVMAMFIAALVVVVILLIYRMRDLLYYDDEDDLGKGFDDLSARKSHGEQKKTTLQPQNDRQKDSFTRQSPIGRTQQKSDPLRSSHSAESRTVGASGTGAHPVTRKPQERTTLSSQGQVKKEAVKPAEGSAPSARRNRNFGADDEDFEFEFLDLEEGKK